LSFTANFQPSLIAPVMLGKIAGGIAAVFFTKFLALKKAEQLEAEDLAALESSKETAIEAA
jgi:ethanolamine transporter